MSTNCLNLTGRVAVVFGASSGLGRAIAIGLAQHGANVVPTARRADLLELVCNAVQSKLIQSCDVRERASVLHFRSEVMKTLGRVDILVNAAGTTFKKATSTVLDEEWTNCFETNLTGVLHTCQAFYPDLKASPAGRVINIASLGSFVAFQEVAAYCATKAALLSLTRSLACEWANDRICVNAIAPGVFRTELNSNLLDGTARGKEILMRTPMNRFGDPQELVGAAVLLASDGASFITGQCLTVDGGFLASGVNA